MKLMVASDIHGSAFYCRKLMESYREEKAEKLILLGDLLYHGPRNALPKEYNPPAVIEMLNEIADEILCVRGNCDSEVDQMVLNFPILSDSLLLWLNGHLVYCTHGHIYHTEALPKLHPGDVLIHGHTHVKGMKDYGTYKWINPGSVSIPKDGTEHSYLIYENGEFIVRSFEGNEFGRMSMDETY